MQNTQCGSSIKLHNYNSTGNAEKHNINNKIRKECKHRFAANYKLKMHLVQHQKSNDKGKLPCMLSSCDLKFSKIDNVIHQAHDADIKIRA